MTPEETEPQFVGAGDTVDSEDPSFLQRDQSTSSSALREGQQQLIDAQIRIAELEKAIVISEPQSGSFLAVEKGWRPGMDSKARCAVKFQRPYAKTPKLLFGLSTIDCVGNKPKNFALSDLDINNAGFSVEAGSWNGCHVYSLGCNWMALPEDLHLETGTIHTFGEPQGEKRMFTQRVTFGQSFEATPMVLVWFRGISYAETTGWFAMQCFAQDVKTNSCTIVIQAGEGDSRMFENATVQYLAYPRAEDGKRVKSARESANHPTKTFTQRAPFYDSPFNKSPSTFIANSKLDFKTNFHLRFQAQAAALNARELEWSYGTWSVSQMTTAHATWIALE